MTVKFRGKEFVPLGGGYFARPVDFGSTAIYRLHWGVVQPNRRTPASMTAVASPDGGYFEFGDLAAARVHVASLAGDR